MSSTDDLPPLRTRVLETALRLITEAGGLAVQLEGLTMEQVVKTAGVSRTSAYREWPSRQAFMVDLMCAIVGPQWQGPEAFEEDTYTLARDVVADHLDRLDTLDGRRWVLGEMVRVAIDHHFLTVQESAQWRAYVALTACLPAMADAVSAQRVHEALLAAEEGWNSETCGLFEDLGILLGFRPAPGMAYQDIAAMLSSVCEGFGVRHLVNPGSVWRDRVVPRPGGSEHWGLVALTCLAALRSMIEFEEQHDVAAALPAYLKRLSSRDRAIREREGR